MLEETFLRNFSKLKLIKTYLRSSMSQKRLNSLTIFSVEKDMLENIGGLINYFASQNAQRNRFYLIFEKREVFFFYIF